MTTPPGRRRFGRGERGSMALIVALLATALFLSAAVAVDLGNAWARKRELQKQVDVAALGAGHQLPMTTSNRLEIADSVAASLTRNWTAGQAPSITGSQLLNGLPEDGEVTFWTDNGIACTNACNQMRVLAPEADVPMYFSGVIGIQGTSVQRSATVRAMSAVPSSLSMLPFWLPSGCALGPADADTSGGGGSSSSTSTTPSPSASSSPSTSGTNVPVGDHTLSGADVIVNQNSSRTISDLTVHGVSKQVDRASIRFYSPGQSYFIEYAATDLKNPGTTLKVADFQISTEVTATPGDWKVYAVVLRNKDLEISANHLVVHVNGIPEPSPTPSPTASPTPASVPVGCVGQDRGNFGQLDSPRKDLGSGQTNKRLAMNIAEGLDHQLIPFVFPEGTTPTKDCAAAGGGFIVGAQPDNLALDGRNCITGDTGNDGPAIFDGLIAGIDGRAGRLSTTRPGNHTTCPGRTDRAVGGTTINNDTLSCFLRGGATLADLASSSGVSPTMLDPGVIDSPRFVWLPVVVATDRAQKGFQPILDFAPAFITDETQTTSASADNGLQINGNSVKTFRLFSFNRDALPVDSRSPTVPLSPALPSIVRLVD